MIDLNNNKILTLQEFAMLKKVSLKTVYNWIKIDFIKPTLIGKTKFILIPKK